ncbi:MAG: FAD-dependent oxidoreductase [Planctomycetaceae bacterium]|nr:FAD-dependent oxidoreductase [Planctomycetaceae bacterium]
MDELPIVIVGAGLAGLCCARRLQQAQVPFLILESTDRVGGRVRTEECSGFRLDVGFQVLLTSYPEVANTLDLPSLNLGSFQSGAQIRYNGKFVRLADPWREPRHLLATAVSGVGTLADKLRIFSLQRDVARGDLDALLERPETTTRERLVEHGFSARIIEGFFEPFFGGVFLEDELHTSSRKFDYLFRLFSTGVATLPAGGMAQIPQQLAAGLPNHAVRLSAPVRHVAAANVELESGERIAAAQVVVACDPWNAARLLGSSKPALAHGTRTLYFAAPQSPLQDPILVLNGDGVGMVRSVCVPSQVSSGYAPADQALISVSLRSESTEGQEGELSEQVRTELSQWFGAAVHQWQHLRTFEIPHALPHQDSIQPPSTGPRFSIDPSGVLVCGDAHDIASIQGAMRSGREVAEHLIKSARFGQ